MQRTMLFYAIGIGIALAHVPFGFSISACSSGTQPAAGSQETSVSEYPHGPIDGNNETFSLTRPALDDEGVKVFENGIEIVQGTGFTLTERKSFTLTRAPLPGDRLMVSYCTAPIINPYQLDKEKAIVHQRFIESVQREISMETLATVATPNGNSIKTHFAVVNSGRPPASLVLLARRLSQSDKRTPSRGEHSHGSLSGFEGTGDGPLATPYSLLMGETGSSRSLVGPTQGDSSPATEPRSLRLLQRRLDAVEDKQLGGTD